MNHRRNPGAAWAVTILLATVSVLALTTALFSGATSSGIAWLTGGLGAGLLLWLNSSRPPLLELRLQPARRRVRIGNARSRPSRHHRPMTHRHHRDGTAFRSSA